MFVAVDETEIPGVVIVVVGVMVENHPTELLLHSRRRLCEVACELQERVVIHFRWGDGFVEQSTGSGHMQPFAVFINIEPFRGEILPFHQSELWIVQTFGKPEREGVNYVLAQIRWLAAQGNVWSIPFAIAGDVVKYLGYRVG